MATHVSERVRKRRNAFKIITVPREQVTGSIGEIDQKTLIEVNRRLAIFLGIASQRLPLRIPENPEGIYPESKPTSNRKWR